MDVTLRHQIDELFRTRWTDLGFDGLLLEEQDCVLLWELGTEVNSGTFDQYLTNSAGDHAELAIAALERLGALELADIVRRVVNTLPGGWCIDRRQRWDRVDAIPDRWEVLQALTNEWYRVGALLEAAGTASQTRLLAAYRDAGLIV